MLFISAPKWCTIFFRAFVVAHLKKNNCPAKLRIISSWRSVCQQLVNWTSACSSVIGTKNCFTLNTWKSLEWLYWKKYEIGLPNKRFHQISWLCNCGIFDMNCAISIYSLPYFHLFSSAVNDNNMKTGDMVCIGHFCVGNIFQIQKHWIDVGYPAPRGVFICCFNPSGQYTSQHSL